MARYTQESIDRLRESLDIVELISERTDLRRSGARWSGLCPFHEENSPSLSVDPAKGVYHCFGCGVGGDAITFVRETQSLDFAEAVEQLAERYRVELKREDEDPQEEERRRRRKRLEALVARAADFYVKYLWESKEAAAARDYLAGRGLTEEVLRTYKVGYAPAAGDKLLAGARRDGFNESELRGADLARKGNRGELYDFFRERIMFPLVDRRGRTLGFGARAMRAEQRAKYLNTGESELYRKGKLLFGLDHARQPIAKSRRVVVVEGYTDVLALHQAGIEDVVAIMGTAMTPDQLGELARNAGERGQIFLALDADGAGQEAMLRAARSASERKIELRVAAFPEGSDPADLVAAKGPEAVGEILESAVSVLQFEVERVIANADLDTPEGRDRALIDARRLIAAAPPRSAVRDHLVRTVADRLDVPPDYVAAQAERPPAAPSNGHQQRPDRAQAVSAARGGAANAAMNAERSFLTLCLAAGPVGLEQLGRLTPEHFSLALTRRAHEHLVAHFGDPLDGLDDDDAELRSMVGGIAMQADDQPASLDGALDISFHALDLRRIERQMRHANEVGDRDRQRDLSAEKQRVRRSLDAAMGQVE